MPSGPSSLFPTQGREEDRLTKTSEDQRPKHLRHRKGPDSSACLDRVAYSRDEAEKPDVSQGGNYLIDWQDCSSRSHDYPPATRSVRRPNAESTMPM